MTSPIEVRRSYPADATLGSFALPDGWALRTFDRPVDAAKGSILWLGGRGDIIEKYLECLADWHAAGWHVTSFDWRGQGGSGRILPDPKVGHIDDFAIWIDDLAHFWADWTARTPAPHIIMGHSMGGHLVLRALVEGRVRPKAAVLVAPMLGFAGNIPGWLAGGVARLLGTLFPRRSAWKQNERPSPPDASRQAYLTNDDDRYADEMWWKAQKPELNLGPPTWGWMAAAARSYAVIDRPGAVEAITLPILAVGTDGDQLVSPAAIRRAVARLRDGDLLMFDKSAAHEVLREVDAVRDAGMARIATFFDTKVLHT
jgi:lysophospholipase